jgi:hypothetical protein
MIDSYELSLLFIHLFCDGEILVSNEIQKMWLRNEEVCENVSMNNDWDRIGGFILMYCPAITYQDW